MGQVLGIYRWTNTSTEFKAPFKVAYKRRWRKPWPEGCKKPWPEVVNVSVSSIPLKKILEEYVPDKRDSYSSELEVKGRDLYRVLQLLKNHVAESAAKSTRTEEEETEAFHLKCLVRFVEREYSDVSVRDRRMKEEKRAPWDMLWTLLPKGTKVGYYCKNSGELLCGVVASSRYKSVGSSKCKSAAVHAEPCCYIVLDVWNFDGVEYKACQIKRHIAEYQGGRDFAQLPVLPFEFLGNPSKLDAEFLAKGKKFYNLAVASTHRFMHYQGLMFKEGYKELIKERSDGRVMIDFTSFVAMNPSGSSHFESKQLRKLKDLSSCWIDGRPVYKPIEVSDESLILAPAIVYGFSFALKEWGAFTVSGFSDRGITFDTKAFEKVTLDPSSKSLVHDLVSQYTGDERHSSETKSSLERVEGDPGDPVSRNEKNCVFLCYGSPGTGKTLMAESIAEKMKRPIWAVKASDLGAGSYDSKKLESNLKNVLQIATKWKAVLFLDDAHELLEIYRSHGTVFFRLLECYRGVLFLATNRIDKVDVDSRSEITLLLHFPELTVERRKEMWHSLLTGTNVEGVSSKLSEFCEKIATEELNGHDIRNAVHVAQVSATSSGEAFAVSHLESVLKTLRNSLETFTEKTDASNTWRRCGR